MRSIGFLLYHASLAAGLSAIGAGVPAVAAKDAIENVRSACSGSGSSITWLGHSSAIIHLGNRCILTDPVIEADTSAESPLPKRLAASPVGIADLPGIETILLSHGDYDHLHAPTLRALADRFSGAQVLAPSGVAAPARLAGYPGARELRNGQAASVGGLKILALPAYHETRRTISAVKTGEAVSWAVLAGRRKVLFIGDTGYGPAYAEIGRTRGPFDVVLVPIGAYEPRHLVADMHVTPQEAIQIARDVGARLAIGIHWGTFALSPDRPQDAVRRFLAAGREAGIAARVLALGETVELP